MIGNAHKGKCEKMLLAADARTLATLGRDNILKFWDLGSYRKLLEVSLQELNANLTARQILQMHFTKDQKHFQIIYQQQNQLFRQKIPLIVPTEIFRLLSRKDIKNDEKNHGLRDFKNVGLRTKTQFRIAISANGKWLAYFIWPDLYLWDIENNNAFRLIKNFLLGDCKYLKFSADNKYFLLRRENSTR